MSSLNQNNNTSNFNSVQARSLWIGEIDSWMDEGFMIKIFQEVANVKNLKIIRDKTKGTSMGYGFIEFESQEIAKEVLQELNGKLIPESNR
jgi:RNA recognition motif-containing protein